MLQVILLVNKKEVPLQIYFKQEKLFDRWVVHHYLCLQAVVEVITGSREFDVVKRSTA